MIKNSILSSFFVQVLFAIILAVFFSIYITKIYSDISLTPSYLGPLIIHTVFVGFYFFYTKKKLQDFSLSPTLLLISAFGSLIWISGYLFLYPIASSESYLDHLKISSIDQVMMVFFVPIIEELFFRCGVTPIFKNILTKKLPAILGSSLLFSLLHSSSFLQTGSFDNYLLPLGPFFLALISEWLYFKCSSIYPSIFFHISCNFTAVITWNFGQFPLEFLKVFYT